MSPVTRRAAVNLLTLLGAWWLAQYLSFWVTVALIPISNRLIYEGDPGVVIMHVWLALPLALMAAVAAPVVLLLSDMKRKGILVAILAGLFVYSQFSRAAHDWTTAKDTFDRLGAVIEDVTPALACAVAGVYWLRRGHTTRSPEKT